MDLNSASVALDGFRGESFRAKIAKIEADCMACTADKIKARFGVNGISASLLSAALLMKRHSRQINEIVHSAGVLLALPHILEPGEKVESVSLAAGNTGRGYDLCTNLRLAEFTFINWQGGPETIRQNKIFKDFFFLAEDDSAKRKELYTIGTDLPQQFFESTRKLAPMLKGSRKLGDAFRDKYGDRFLAVCDYYEFRRNRVSLRDISEVVPLFRTAMTNDDD